jgi:hypothetical protein
VGRRPGNGNGRDRERAWDHLIAFEDVEADAGPVSKGFRCTYNAPAEIPVVVSRLGAHQANERDASCLAPLDIKHLSDQVVSMNPDA